MVATRGVEKWGEQGWVATEGLSQLTQLYEQCTALPPPSNTKEISAMGGSYRWTTQT